MDPNHIENVVRRLIDESPGDEKETIIPISSHIPQSKGFGSETLEDRLAWRKIGVHEMYESCAEILDGDEGEEADVFTLWEKCTDFLMRSGYWERDGARLLNVGAVQIHTDGSE